MRAVPVCGELCRWVVRARRGWWWWMEVLAWLGQQGWLKVVQGQWQVVVGFVSRCEVERRRCCTGGDLFLESKERQADSKFVS
eukprot:1161829-Pelagomonas_calceolata.AAC.22